MLGDVGISFFAGVGVFIWVYGKFARRATGGEMIKNVTPAGIAGFMTFLIMLSILSAVF